ncbi:MAG: autotransporter domain-containing protein [Verrucomicrobiota bacterium]
MKPSRKLLSTVIFFTMSSHLLHAATDITISNGFNTDITGASPFGDSPSDGGTSNLNVVTLVGALGATPVQVTTATAAGVAPSGGRITVLDSVTWNTPNTLSLVANSNIVIGATITTIGGGSLNLNAATTVAFDADVTLIGAPANLTVTSGGISQALVRKLLIDGLADLNGGTGAITLLSVNRFGSLKLTGGAVTVNEADSTLLTGVEAATLTLTTAGAITDSSGAVINVSGLASLNAGGNAITLGDNVGDTTNFGSLSLTGGAVTITEDSGTLLTDVTATSLNLTSAGAITDSAGAVISVNGLATFKAGANEITLGDSATDTTNFGSLNLAGGAVTVAEDSSTLLTGVAATSLNLTSAGTITDSAGTAINVTGLATLDAGANAITLGDSATDTTNFGSLHLTGGVVAITEDSGTLLASVSATTYTLTSAGAITDSAGTVTNVSGLATLKGTSIVLGGASNSTAFGSLNFSSVGSVSLQLDSAATISGANTASTMVLDTTGTSTFAAGATLNAASLTVQGGGLTLSGNNLADGMGLTLGSGASLNMGAFNETVGTFTSNNGTLAGTGTLTATTYTLNGGTINAKLGTGILNQLSNTSALNGTSAAATVNVNGGTLTLGAANRLNNAAAVTVGGTLDLGTFSDTVGTFTLNPAGVLAGSGTLTATGGATLNGGTVEANLIGDTTSRGPVLVSGALGGGSLAVTGGTLTLTGTSTNTPVGISINAGLLDASGGLDDAAIVTNAGLLTVDSADSVTTYTQNATGGLAGSATLTVTGAVTLKGGTVAGHLLGDTTSTGNLLISGSVGGGSLSATGGTLTLTGTSTNNSVAVSSGAALLDANGGLAAPSKVTNAGLLTVNFADEVQTYTQNGNGILAGSAALTATDSATLKGGKVLGHLLGNTTSTGSLLVSGSVGGGSLSITGGTLTLTGTSTNNSVAVSSGASLLDSAGGLDAAAGVTNAGLLTVKSADSVLTYIQNGNGMLAGSAALTTTGGATLNGGKISGRLLGDTTSTGNVLVSGSVGGGFLQVNKGTLTLSGTANSNTLINAGATLKGTGLVNGNVENKGTLAVGTMGGKLTISGDLVTRGTIALNLNSSKKYEQIVAGTVDLGGKLVITNTGSGLARGQRVAIIDAGYLSNGIKLKSFTTVGFDNGLLFNNHTGDLIGLAGGKSSVSGAYLNLSPNQTNTYLALFDDSVQAGKQNVARKSQLAGTGEDIRFTSGESDGDSQLVEALNHVTFISPGSINAATMNNLSPEVYRGLADFTEQALRAQVRQAVDAAPVSQKGRTQVYATLHSTSDGVDDSGTNAGYDIDIYGATTGMRYVFNENFMLGALLGVDGGDINGPMIDTDAQGFVLGTFGTYQFNDACKTMITGAAAFGNYTYDAARHSFGGDVHDDNIDSDAVELSLGVSSVVYEKHGLRVSPGAALRYIGGKVDSFVENGAGIPLAVESQDIDTFLFDVGIDLSYQVTECLSLAGRVGYMDNLSDPDESVSATFAASGPAGVPFAVGAPGIDNQAVTLDLGLYYDITENARVGATYRAEFRTESETSQTFGIGASYGF